MPWTWVRRGGWVLVALGVVVVVVQGANRPADPRFDLAPTPLATGEAGAAGRRPLEGFAEVPFEVAAADGRLTEGCALLADTPETRARGLMDQPDLRGYEGMVFRFEEPSSGGFYMRDTILALSIGWFAEDGRFVGSADMDPCPDSEIECPTFSPGASYTTALEVGQGDLGELGIADGSVLSFPAGLDAPCPTS